MNRLIIIGKNNELSREPFSRAAWHALGSSHALTRQAVLYSGHMPDSAAGRPPVTSEQVGQSTHAQSGFPALLPKTPSAPPLGVTRRDLIDIGIIFAIGLAVVGLMVLAAI